MHQYFKYIKPTSSSPVTATEVQPERISMDFKEMVENTVMPVLTKFSIRVITTAVGKPAQSSI